MPSNRSSLRLTEDYRAKLTALSEDAQQAARSSWGRLDYDNLSSSYVPLGDAIARAVERGQREAVYLTAGYLGAFLSSELGQRVSPPTVRPNGYVGKSFRGEPLRPTLDKPLIATLVAIREVQQDPLGIGLRALLANVDLDVKQAARQALIDEIEADERIDGFIRSVRGTCPACASKAGADGHTKFPVHPHCQCIGEPNVKVPDNKRNQRLSGEQRFDRMSYQEQDELLGPDLAQAVRDNRVKLADLGSISADGKFLTNLSIQEALAEHLAERSPLGFRARIGRVTKGIDPDKPKQPVNSLDEIYARADAENRALEEFLDLGRGVSRELGAGELRAAEGNFIERAAALSAEERPQVIIAPIKKRATAEAKLAAKHKQPQDLRDVTRASILVHHADDIPGAVAKLRSYADKQGWDLLNAENGFLGPSKSGYRDLAVLLRSPSGFIHELQFHIDPMWAAKFRGQGHDLYVEWRRLNAIKRGGERPLTAGENSKLLSLERQMKRMYDRAWKAAKPTRGTERVRDALEPWQREGRKLFREDLKNPDALTPASDYADTVLSVPERNAANTYGSPNLYKLFQQASRDPSKVLKEAEDFKSRGGVMPRTMVPSDAVYGFGFESTSRLTAEEIATEIERQSSWLTHAIARHGEEPPLGTELVRMTGMDHLPEEILLQLAQGEQVDLQDTGYLAFTDDLEVADFVSAITAKEAGAADRALWHVHTDGVKGLHTNGVDPHNHPIDEWIYPPRTPFTIKLRRAAARGRPAEYDVHLHH